MKTNYILFKVYLIAGAFTFSGGMAMLPLIEKELCTKRNLISNDQLNDYTTLSQVFPGVIALTNACFIGRKINGFWGMLAAGIGAILPAYLLMSLATVLYHYIPDHGPFLNILSAIRVTSASFLLVAALSLARHNLTNWLAYLIAETTFLSIILFKISAPTLILIAFCVSSLLVLIKKGAKK